MRIRLKQSLINLLIIAGFLSALALSTSLVNRLNEIQNERHQLYELEISIRTTLTQGAWLLQDKNKDKGWADFNRTRDELKKSFAVVSALESIPQLNDTIYDALNTIEKLQGLMDKQEEALTVEWDKMQEELAELPPPYLEGRSLYEIIYSIDSLEADSRAYIEYALTRFNGESLNFETTLLTLIRKLDDNIIIIEEQLKIEKKKIILHSSIILFIIILAVLLVSQQFAQSITSAIEKITESLFNMINSRKNCDSVIINRDDELGYLSENISVIFEQLMSVKNELEKRVLERTAEL